MTLYRSEWQAHLWRKCFRMYTNQRSQTFYYIITFSIQHVTGPAAIPECHHWQVLAGSGLGDIHICVQLNYVFTCLPLGLAPVHNYVISGLDLFEPNSLDILWTYNDLRKFLGIPTVCFILFVKQFHFHMNVYVSIVQLQLHDTHIHFHATCRTTITSYPLHQLSIYVPD